MIGLFSEALTWISKLAVPRTMVINGNIKVDATAIVAINSFRAEVLKKQLDMSV